jgi:hypothetical protein
MLPPAPLRPQVWKSIELRIGRERVAFARPLFWQTASGVFAVAAVPLAIGLFR